MSLSKWGRSIGTGILGGLIVMGMTLLLIIPGIIWSGYYVFIFYVVALREISGKHALDYSKELVKGQWWRVCGVLLIINILGLLSGLALASPNFFLPENITENFIFSIITDTLTDVIGALFTVMSIVFFLNSDYQKYGDKNMLSDSIQYNQEIQV